MKKTTVLIGCFSLLVTFSASARCMGTGAYSHCYDDYGNEYDVQRMGGMTQVNGYNTRTGTSWTENTYDVGNTTIVNGRSSDGNSWDETIMHMGNSTLYQGTDSRGNSFSKYCIDTVIGPQCY